MEHQLKLSEIVKYLLLGAISVLLIDVTILLLYDANPISKIDIGYIDQIVGDKSLVVAIVAVVISYIVGLLLHTMNEAIVFGYHKTGNNMKYYQTLSMSEYNLDGKKGWFDKCKNIFYSHIYKSTVAQVCEELHENGRSGEIHCDWIPSWVSLSYRPAWMLDLLAEKVARDKNGLNTEFLYLHEFIIGLRSMLIALVLIALCSICHNFCWCQLGGIVLFVAAALLLWLLLSHIAKIFAIKYITYIDSCYQLERYNSDDADATTKGVGRILKASGIPCAYIMVRTTTDVIHDTSKSFADDIAKTIMMQDYPNKTVIIYEDLGELPIGAIPEGKLRNNPIVEKLNQDPTIDVIFCADYLGSAAQASLEIRKVFLDSAAQDDVAILLDDDDEFTTSDAVTKIMLKLSQYNADICMIGYNEISNRGLSIIDNRKDYEILLRNVNQLNRSVTFENIPKPFHAATMGWTKCYKKGVVQRYCALVDKCDNVRRDSKYGKEFPPFGDLKAYEDFPDYICMLLPGCKIVAIEEALYNYRKQLNSITANCTVESFDVQRIGFLLYAQQLMNVNPGLFGKQAQKSMSEFIAYKLSVIKNILKSKNPIKYIVYTDEDFQKSYDEQHEEMERICKL